MPAGARSQPVHRSLLSKWQLLCIGVGLAVVAALVLFPVWKNEPGGVWYRYLLAPELGRSFILTPPNPNAVVHLTRMWWDIAMVAAATAGLVWIAAPRATDERSTLAKLSARRAKMAAVAAVCLPLPIIPVPLWVLTVSLLAAGGVGSHHAGLPASIAVPVLVLAAVLYAVLLYGVISLVLHLAAHWVRG